MSKLPQAATGTINASALQNANLPLADLQYLVNTQSGNKNIDQSALKNAYTQAVNTNTASLIQTAQNSSTDPNAILSNLTALADSENQQGINQQELQAALQTAQNNANAANKPNQTYQGISNPSTISGKAGQVASGIVNSAVQGGTKIAQGASNFAAGLDSGNPFGQTHYRRL